MIAREKGLLAREGFRFYAYCHENSGGFKPNTTVPWYFLEDVVHSSLRPTV